MLGKRRETIRGKIPPHAEVDRAIKEAVLDGLRQHKRAGQPVAVWKDGQAVMIPPEEIVLPSEVEETGDQ